MCPCYVPTPACTNASVWIISVKIHADRQVKELVSGHAARETETAFQPRRAVPGGAGLTKRIGRQQHLQGLQEADR